MIIRALNLRTLMSLTASSLVVFAGMAHGEPEQMLESEIRHAISTQIGYGPSRNLPGQQREGFGFLRYQFGYSGYVPTREWPTWTLHSRVWFDYSNQMEFQTEPEPTRNDGASIEWRDFYVQRHGLLDDPRLSLAFGRQTYRDLSGLWWNTSLESVRLQWTDTFRQGFLAVAHPLHSFNTGEGSLLPEQQDITYLLGEFSWRWSADDWAGLRMLGELGHGDRAANSTRALRLGAFMHGEPMRPWLSDYWAEAVVLHGERDERQPDDTMQSRTINGWAVVAEVGKQHPLAPGRPRVALRLAITDSAQDPTDGFYLNALQSAKSERTGGYSNGLAGAMPNLTFSNMLLYGLLVELQPSRNLGADFLLAGIRCRSDDGALPLRLDVSNASCQGSNAGHVLDSNLTFRPFPVIWAGYRMHWFNRVNLTFFHNGGANPVGDDDFRISLHSELTF